MAKHARDLSLNAAAVRKYVEENFSTARMAKAYLEVYRTALREKPKEKVA